MKETLIRIQNVEYTYTPSDVTKLGMKAICDVTLTVPHGEFLVIVGSNGSGKSTLARLINGLLIPTKGSVFVDDINTRDETMLWEVHKKVGLVFQNPENQIIGTFVEEDVAFGPENIGLSSEQIRKRVDQALHLVGLSELREMGTQTLSGGQKQLLAIAGILALLPKVIVLDEATSMLDVRSRKLVLEVLKKIHQEEKLTMILITHHMDEAVAADRLLVMDEGRIVRDGSPEEIFSDVLYMKSLGLEVPPVTELLYELNAENGFSFSLHLDVEGAAKEILRLMKDGGVG